MRLKRGGAKRRTHWAWRVARTAALLYAVLLIGGYMYQEHLIFPGAFRPRDECAVTPPKGCELVRLATPMGKSTVALFGPALTTRGDPHPDAAACPSILYFYGNGMCLADSAQFEFPEFRRLGCNVMIVEYVGFGLAEGSPSEQGCFQAADAAYAALAARPDVDPRRIIAGGWSLGGAVACHIAATRPVIGLFMFSSFTSMTDVARTHYPFLPVSMLLKYPFPSIDVIGGIKAPLLIGHGTADDIVPYWMSVSLRDAAKGSSRVTHFKVEGAGHNDFYTMGEGEIERQLGEFVCMCAAAQ